MNKRTLWAAVAALSVALNASFGATKFQQKLFAEGDSDGNKALSKAEFVAVKMGAAKKSAEKNNREFKAEAVKKRMGKLFDKADSNSDGKLSADEFYGSFPQKKK